jgi:outer membrane protein insertion porin family
MNLSSLLLGLLLAADPAPPKPLVFHGVEPGLQSQLRAHWRFLGNHVESLEAAMKRVYFGTGKYLAKVEIEDIDGTLHITVRNARVARIRRVSFVGNKVLSDAELMPRLVNREDAFSARMAGLGRYLPQARGEDRTGLRSAYHDRGYIFVEITGPRVTVDPDLGGVRLEFTLKEGPRYQLGDLKLSGMPEGFRFPYESGEPFAVSRIRGAVQATLDRYRAQGYALAKVNEASQVHHERRQVSLELNFDKGPLCTIADIRVEGLQRLDPDRVRQLLRVRPGQFYDHRLLKEEIGRLRGLGLILDGAVEAQAGEKPGEVIAVLHLADAMQRWFPAFSMTYLPGEGTVLLLQLSSPNLAQRALRFYSSLWLSGQRQLFDLSLSQPGYFHPLDSAGIEIHNRDRQMALIRTQTQGLSLSYGMSLDARRRWRISSRFLLDRVVSTAQSLPSGFEAASDALQTRFFKDYPSGQANGRIKLSLNLSYDTRDSGLLATRGTSVSLGLGYGYSAPPNWAGNLETSAQWKGYLRLPGQLRFRSRIGARWNLTDAPHPSDLMVVGGMTTLRGFLTNRIGPVLQDDPRLVVGGDRVAQGSVELGRPLNSVLEPFIFADAANAFSRENGWFHEPNTVRPLVGGMALSTGFGILVRLPVLPLRFEWGWPLTRGETDPEWLFSLGVGTGV